MSHQTGGMINKCRKPDGMQWKPVLQQPHKPVHTLTGQSWCLAYCGGPLLETLPGNWAGTSALVQLAIPFTLSFRSPARATTPKKKKDTDTDTIANRRGSFPPHVYIDAIGVPRGVPNSFKARNQIAVGFESVFFLWSTINKNVNWINYIYYNQ
jgi:hypothetical protein